MSASQDQSEGFPPYNQRPSQGYTREETLWVARTMMEGYHRALTRLFAVTLAYRVPLKVAGQFPPMTVSEVLDTCNKSVALYFVPRRRPTIRLIVLHNYIYRRWFRPYQSEIELGRFICRTITPTNLPEVSATESMTGDLISLNGAICAEIKARHRTYDDLVAAGQEIPGWKATEVNNHRLYILQPLFQALFIVVCDEVYVYEDSTTVGRFPVLLVRTGIEDGLSAPITFESITGTEDKATYVKTTLETAIDFIMSLEAREVAAFGLNPSAEAAWESSPKHCCLDFREDLGDEPVIGPSSRFVDCNKYPRWGGSGKEEDEVVGMNEQRELRRQAREKIEKGLE
ncbi:hypothetical protein AK830_g4472 [Neonectria ditissima]|uniref:Uncharacterized protein n=1 Tax=Neonectria ditissima TaxID=78410 RepID=A0A0P7B6B9_9HYPO|nr:hypothetical protein AK830_g4472 [Neonectria ditissima]